MKNKLIKKFGIYLIFLIAGIFLLTMASAQETSVCCEKTNYGAWCQNSKQENCDNSINPFTNQAYRTTPTSCDATSFCREGCCYDSQEGICMENTPQLVCQQGNGTWADSAKCEIPQCNLGCCLLDNQAAFTTLVRCKRIAGFYGVQVNFRTDVKSETACIALAQAQDRGACVFEEQFTRTCRFTTRGECEDIRGKRTNITGSNITFYKDYLCSAEELGTNCAPSKKTACIPGKDEVYFIDSCGNPANVYDSSKINDKAYWKKIIQKKDSCNSASSIGNANSASCGNCDYFAGSFCRQYDRNKDKTRPSYGDYVCRDLNCYKTQDGKDYKHGESWCIYDDGVGKGKDPAGSRHWKHVCIAGEELVEPCDDFRQSVCIQDKITTEKGDFQQAGCAANKWQDCVSQKSQKDCENIDKRDCLWIEGAVGSAILSAIAQTDIGKSGSSFLGGSEKTSEKEKTTTAKGGVCVPNYPPGLAFWKTGEAQGICSLGNAKCEVEYEKKGLFGGSKKAVKNAECESESWKQKNEQICQALGDCGGKEGVYKYLESGGFGVSGTKLFLPLVDYITGNIVSAQENKSVNKGLIESLRSKN